MLWYGGFLDYDDELIKTYDETTFHYYLEGELVKTYDETTFLDVCMIKNTSNR